MPGRRWRLIPRGRRQALPLAFAAGLALLGCLLGVATAEGILLVSPPPPSVAFSGAPTPNAAPTATARRASPTPRPTRTPTPIQGPGGGGYGPPTPTPPPTFPPATPTPPMYSVRIVSKVFGTGKPWVGWNLQGWPPDSNLTVRISYSVCAAQGWQQSLTTPTWSEYGVAEVDVDVGTCWQVGTTIQLNITAYWTTGQTANLQTTATVNW